MIFKSFLLRALAISTLKNVVYLGISIGAAAFILGFVPMKVYGLVIGAIFFLNTFLFSEWIFSSNLQTPRMVALAILLTYFWDMFISILVWSSLLDADLFTKQRLLDHLLFFGLHAVAMVAALIDRKRLGPPKRRGSTEGLAS